MRGGTGLDSTDVPHTNTTRSRTLVDEPQRQVPRTARAWVAALLTLLLVPGIIGFDFWPLTGWRMYSVSSTSTRLDWVVEAATPDGPVDLGWAEFPLAYRLAAWPLADFESFSAERREGICLALLEGARAVLPNTAAVTIRHDLRTLNDDGSFTAQPATVYRCGDL